MEKPTNLKRGKHKKHKSLAAARGTTAYVLDLFHRATVQGGPSSIYIFFNFSSFYVLLLIFFSHFYRFVSFYLLLNKQNWKILNILTFFFECLRFFCEEVSSVQR